MNRRALQVLAGGLSWLGMVVAVPAQVGAGTSGAGTPRLAATNVRLAVGSSHACVILDGGQVACWGRNDDGQLGYGNTTPVGDNEFPAANPVNGGIVQLPGGLGAVAIAAGERHTCVVLTDGSVACWGFGGYGQLGYGNTTTIGDNETPASAGTVSLPAGIAVGIAAGGNHTCALMAYGGVVCWGNNLQGQLGYGNTSEVGTTSGNRPSVVGTVPLPSGRYATQISAGLYHTCARFQTGEVACWGWGNNGRLGYGNTSNVGDTPTTRPADVGVVALPGGQTATAVTAGESHTCALLANGTVSCWGSASLGELGYGNTTQRTTPGGAVALPGSQTATALMAADGYSCAILADTMLSCWGRNDFGELGRADSTRIGDNETPASQGPVALPGGQGAAAVAGGGAHPCVLLSTGGLACWGFGGNGRLGYANTNTIGDDETPADNPVHGGLVPLPGAQGVEMVSAGGDHTCVVLSDGKVSCWGLGTSGQLGDGTNVFMVGRDETAAMSPANGGIVRLPGNASAVAVDAGLLSTCALLASGEVACWGNGADGRLGYGNTTTVGLYDTPADVGVLSLPGGRDAVDVTVGWAHACALYSDGTVSCWGDNLHGQLGQGNTIDIGDNELPSTVGVIALGGPAVAIEAGLDFNCALLADGSVNCWGKNDYGQLGRGNESDIGDNETPAAAGPIPLPGGQKAIDIAVGDRHACAVLASGAVACWGWGQYGQLGYGNTNDIGDDETAAAAGTLALPTGVNAIAAGGAFTCARVSGSVRCWGFGETGALGYANEVTIGDNEVAGAVGYLSLPGSVAVSQLTTGSNHACARFTSGTVTCWGYGAAGRLGYGNANDIGDDETPAANPVNGGMVPVPQAWSPVDFESLLPARLLDTRPNGATADGLFQATGQVAAGTATNVRVLGRGDVPVNASAVTVTVTAVNPATAGYLTVYQCDIALPNASNVNYQAGVNTANTAVVRPTASDGTICIYTSAATHVIVDVSAYTPATSALATFVPARLMDTRPTGTTIDHLAEKGGVRTAGSTTSLTITSRAGVPLGTRTVILNVTAVQPAVGGYVTVYPCGGSQPNASNVNYAAGVTTANLVITRVSATGTICLFTNQATHLIVDVSGYAVTGSPGPSRLQTFVPARVLDTRPAGVTVDGQSQAIGQRGAGTVTAVPLAGRFPVATIDTAVVNVTVVNPTATGYVTVFPCENGILNASNLNYVAGVNRAVQVLVKTSVGQVCVFTSQATHLIVDIAGASL